MQIDYLRASGMNNYDACAFQYYLKYLIGMPDDGNQKAHYGTIVHLALELLAKVKKTGHYKLKDAFCDPEYLLEISWNRMVKDQPNFTWTKEGYDFCKKQMDVVLKSNLNPLHKNILYTELQFEIELNAPGFVCDWLPNKPYAKLRGTIDLITKDGEAFHIYDWKTGTRKGWITGKLKELEDFQEELQLLVYDLALSILFPNIKERYFTMVYTQDGGPFTVSFNDQEREKTISILRNYFARISSDDHPSRLKENKEEYKKRSWQCQHVCAFGKNGNKECDDYYNILKNSSFKMATQRLMQISRERKPLEASRRNDYSRANIYRGKLC